MTDSIEQLRRALERAPVMGNIHPLVPLCLPAGVEVVAEADTIADQLDDFESHPERPVLITNYDLRYKDRFLAYDASRCPSSEAINQALPHRLDYARRHLLTHRSVGHRIVSDARQRGYQTIALLLVDGLSYDDTIEWPDRSEPCFVDGPSITSARTPEKLIVLDIGFPAIVGNPPLARQLANVGIQHSRGFSYWDRAQNDVSAMLFQGVPLARVNEISEALDALRTIKLPGLYLQLVREGLDGLAHRRREVTTSEVQAAVKAIHDDYHQLIGLLVESNVRGAVYLVADHGILWKKRHRFLQLEGSGPQHPRFASEPPLDTSLASRFEMQHQTYYLYHYPYLGCQIRANDSGVHGGLSYWESIVPFVRVEVNV